MAATSPKPPTKTEVLSYISEDTGMTRKQVTEVFESLNKMIKKNLGRRGPGVFSIPGLLKMTVVKKDAVPEREGINPFTKEPTIFKAKPARRIVKLRALKGLKEMA